MKHLLVTNDYPPKVGGIQNYLWELWRRLPPDSFEILTRPYRQNPEVQKEFDEKQEYKIHRSAQNFLLPTQKQAVEIRNLAGRIDAGLIIFDPAIPVGSLGPQLDYPYGLILHGAEVSVPARVPILKNRLAKVFKEADFLITASKWALSEAERICPKGQMPLGHYIPPGVDIERFKPLSEEKIRKIRKKHKVDEEDFLLISISRLVPRKGMDSLIKAVAKLNKGIRSKNRKKIKLLIAGDGRDSKRLTRIIRQHSAPARLLGRITNEELPLLFGAGDLFAMACRTRWNGLEQEGFGIVFVEAASCAIPSIAGKSGGAEEAVVEGETGLVLQNPKDTLDLAEKIYSLMKDEKQLKAMGRAARKRIEAEFSYDILAGRLSQILK